MPVLPTSGSVKGSDVLLALKNRLVEALDDDPDLPIDESFVRIVVTPGPNYGEYRAERGVALRFSSPVPFTTAGAGRYGLLTKRTLEVYVGTQNLSDPAMNDQIATLAHLDLEEKIVDVLVDASPVPTVTRIGTTVRWIPGGAEIERQVKKDAGMLFSVLLFEVEYVPPLRVTRDAS